MQRRSEAGKPVLDDAALAWAWRIVWLICVAVYLTVFIGGIQDGGAELPAMARAVAFTLATGVLGKLAIVFLSRASLAVEEGRSANQVGPLGSLDEVLASANVAQHDELAEAA